MFWGKENSTRLGVLESTFDRFKEDMVKHMRSEENSFKEFNRTLKDIHSSLEISRKEANEANVDMKKELLDTVDKRYYTDVEVEEKLTSMRKSILEDIDKDTVTRQSNLSSNVRAGLLLVTLTLSLCGWWYINIDKPMREYHLEIKK